MGFLFRDANPTLSPNTLVDDGFGVETSIGSKIVGTWEEIFQAPGAAGAVTEAIYIAPFPIEVVGVQCIFATASTSGTVTVEKDTGTTAPGSGTAVLTGTMSLAGTANTTVTGTLVSAPGTLQFAKGDKVAVVFGGTLTNLVGLCVSVLLKRI